MNEVSMEVRAPTVPMPKRVFTPFKLEIDLRRPGKADSTSFSFRHASLTEESQSTFGIFILLTANMQELFSCIDDTAMHVNFEVCHLMQGLKAFITVLADSPLFRYSPIASDGPS